jgi:hypothetical protein
MCACVYVYCYARIAESWRGMPEVPRIRVRANISGMRRSLIKTPVQTRAHQADNKNRGRGLGSFNGFNGSIILAERLSKSFPHTRAHHTPTPLWFISRRFFSFTLRAHIIAVSFCISIAVRLFYGFRVQRSFRTPLSADVSWTYVNTSEDRIRVLSAYSWRFFVATESNLCRIIRSYWAFWLVNGVNELTAAIQMPANGVSS